jgi:O-antigen/teichoic acid export membrane protein
MLGVLKRRGGFAHRAGTLFGATAAGQAITIAAAPLITRLYQPVHFGSMAVFASIAAILTAVSTAQYHSAVVLPENERDGFAIMLGAWCLAFATAVAVLCAALAESVMSGRTPIVGAGLALYVLSLGVNEAANHWLMRRGEYSVLAANRLGVVILGTLLTLGFGVSGRLSEGLIAGLVIGQTVPAAIVALYVAKKWTATSVLPSRATVTGQLRRYKRFPIYALPGELVNSLTNALPVLLITRFFGAHVSGLFALTQRMLGMPIALIARAILDVFKQRASRDFATTGRCDDIYRKTFVTLCVIGIPGFGLIALTAPEVFALVFGEQWRTSGEYARILAPMFLLRFIIGPLSYTLYIAERQRLDLALQVLLLLSTGGSLTLGLLTGSPRAGLIAFSAAYSAIYLVYLGTSWIVSKGHGEPRA